MRVADERIGQSMSWEVDTASLPEEVRNFRPRCPNCSPEVVLDARSRPCSFYDCSGLPSQLHVTCDICVYDFFADEGTVKCDQSTCETALRLKENIPIYRAWLRLLEEEQAVAIGA